MGRRSFIWVALLSFALRAAEAPSAPGVPNFHQVDEHVYRGAQPNRDGFKSLAKLGIKTVVDLRGGGDHTAGEKDEVEALGMRYVPVPMKGMRAPADADVAKVLEMIDSPDASSNWPVFIHCKRGADRTGTVIACYRIRHDHWDNAKALTEARASGMSLLERAMMGYVLRYQPPAGAEPANKNQTPASIPATR